MALDVARGLATKPKYISSRYFYDDRGDKLFQQIMNMPEYYPTACEFEIFETYKDDLLQYLPHQEWDLVELGAGDGRKTKVLLKHFLQQQSNFAYFPIDISGAVLHHLKQDLAKALPYLPVKTLNYEYFNALEQLNQMDKNPRLVLFLGGNIGNFKPAEAQRFYQSLFDVLRPGDLLLNGIDLRKNPLTILSAYNDKGGVTRAFNLNLLARFNRELGADFKVENFQHYPTYNPVTGETLSYLMSTCNQDVRIEKLNQTFHFEANEPIHTEVSQKYSFQEIENLAQHAGFEVLHHFTDAKDWFADSLWRKP